MKFKLKKKGFESLKYLRSKAYHIF